MFCSHRISVRCDWVQSELKKRKTERKTCFSAILNKLFFHMGLRNDFCLIFPCSRDLGGFCCYFHCYHLFFLLLLLLVLTPKLCHTWVDVCPSFGWESGSFKDSVQAVACLLFFFQLFGCCFHFQTPSAPDAHLLFRFMGESWTGSLVERREWLAWNESRQVEGKTKQKQRTIPRATGMNPKAGEILKTGLRKHTHARSHARTHVQQGEEMPWAQSVILKETRG